MPLAPLIPDPALAEDEYAVRIRKQFEREPEFAERWLAAHDRTMAEYRAAAKVWHAQDPKRRTRVDDPDYLDGDYEMIGTRQAYEFGE